ncbi:MAG: carboxypeptidase regulatory-like domain-containing protein, partial [Bacteroidales bacterium]|nr:carboxypeptidase regulatory-like domain-containing protein [Bacteroidales bacterium]
WVKFEPNGIVVSNSQDYYIALKSSTYESSNYFVYGIGEDQTMAYKIVVSDAFVAKTDKDGNYSVKVSNPFTGKLYAFANDLEFEPLSFKDASKNLTGQNFKTGSENIFNTISGKVLDEQSKGIAYAEVSLTADKQAAKTVKADANGAYSIDVEKNFTGNIYAFADGYVFDPISVSKVSGVLTGKDFKGTSKYVTISGKVTDENNKGIPSAEVSLTSDKQADKTVKTAGDGSYSMQIEKNYSGKLYAFAYGRDFDPLTLSGVRTDLTNQNFKELPKFITISGTVTDASSKPLAGVAITNSKDKIVESLDAQIEATGQYYCATSTCPHCNNTFKLSHSYITKAEIKCYSRGNPGNLSLCIQNTQKETLWEKILTPSDLSQYGEWTTVEVGFSVDVAKEYIIRLLPENKYTNTDYYAYATGGAEEKVAYRLYTGTDRAITDNKGNYSITIRRHSDVTLYAISDDAEFDPLTLNDVATNLTGKNFKAKATQPKTFTISGKVTDANSKAIAGAEVSLTADKQASKTVKADNNGNYTITVDRGFSGNLYAFANGYEFTTISISNVTANQTGKNFKGTEVQVFYTISGKVTDAASKAISGAEVSLSPDRPTGQTVKTDRNGTFSLTVEKNFIGKIYVFADGYNFEPLAISKVTADATGQVIKGVKLLITYTITGKVYDENYLAVADAEVSITTDRAVGKTVKTDNNGYYAISVEENFSGKLYAFANNYEFTPLTLNKVTANLTNQDFRGVEICDSKTVTISGKVMDVNYNTIAGAEVYTAVDGKTVTTLDKEKTSEGTIYMVDTRDFSRNYTANTFTPSENKIGRIEFKVQYWGTPGKLTLAVLDKSRKAVWQKDMSSDEISNDAWTAVDLDLAVTAGQQYYVALKENSTSNRCYAYYDTDADDGMVYKIYSLTGGQTRKSVQTNAAG